MTSATRYLLLRHGQIAANRRGRWHGITDSPLTRKGRRQAKLTARYLAAHETVHAIYTSPLQRCRQTAAAVGDSLDVPVVANEGLQEMSIGDWEDMTFRELAQSHDFVNRATKDTTYAAPAGESLSDVGARVTGALESIDDSHGPDETILVVSHGVALAVLLAELLHDTPARWVDYHFDNCSLTELFLEPKPYVESFNRSAHLYRFG